MGTTSDTGRGLVEDTLEHFGVKGMKWGIRKDPGSYKTDGDWANAVINDRKVHTTIASDAIAKFNSSKEFAALRNNPKFTATAMQDRSVQIDAGVAASKVLRPFLEKSIKDSGYGTSPSKKFNLTANLTLESTGQSLANPHIRFLVKDKDRDLSPQDIMRITAQYKIPQYEVAVAAKHSGTQSDNVLSEFVLDYEFDDSGMLKALVLGENTVDHSSLAHYGVLGMKWGIRKDRQSRSETAVTVKTKKGKGVVKTSGGNQREASEEAIKKAAVRQKGKASSLDSLTNEELKAYNQRKELEKKYLAFLAEEGPKKSKGRKFAENLLKEEWDAASQGKPGPILRTGAKITVGLVTVGLLKGSGKHRGATKVGAATVAAMLKAGSGKHRA